MRDHTKLRAFELADELVIEVYKASKHFPKEEIYGLTSQMRRAAISVSSNIVEGSYRESQTEYLRFLEMAFCSLKESHYQFDLAFKLGFVNQLEVSTVKKKFLETEKVLAALIRKLRGGL